MSTVADSADLSLEQQVLTLKFLVSGQFAGSIIGTGGKAIKELMEVSNAKIIVSGAKDYYPGTIDRILVLSGNREALLIAITLIWELLYIQAKAAKSNTKAPEWSPLASKNFLTAKEDIELTTRITIPAAAGGLILGRAGATLQKITESSGADVKMTTKEEAIFTQERIVTITGPVSKGRICTQMILEKMREEVESNTYANRGTKYTPVASGLPALRGQRRPRSDEEKEDPEPVKDTTITMTIPNAVIGNILGKNGSTLKEMVSLSGAKITVSAREESTDGNRTVTITGSPTAAQTAHAFCNEKIRRGKFAKNPSAGRRKEGESHE